MLDSTAKTSALAIGRITVAVVMKREGKILWVVRVLNNLGTRSSLVAQKYCSQQSAVTCTWQKEKRRIRPNFALRGTCTQFPMTSVGIGRVD